MKKLLLGIIAINLILITGKMYLSNMQTAQAETSNEAMVCKILLSKKGNGIEGLDKCKKGDILDIKIRNISLDGTSERFNSLLRVCEYETISVLFLDQKIIRGHIASCIYSGRTLEVRD